MIVKTDGPFAALLSPGPYTTDATHMQYYLT